jgi:hypothetical protein
MSQSGGALFWGLSVVSTVLSLNGVSANGCDLPSVPVYAVHRAPKIVPTTMADTLRCKFRPNSGASTPIGIVPTCSVLDELSDVGISG